MSDFMKALALFALFIAIGFLNFYVSAWWTSFKVSFWNG